MYHVILLFGLCVLHPVHQKQSIKINQKYTIINHNLFESRKRNFEKLERFSQLSYIKIDDNYIIINDKYKSNENALKYLENNKLDSFELFTILNECCKSIMLYHVLLNCYHSNTSIGNFNICNDNTCQISSIESDDKILTKQKNVIDYVTFFDSFIEALYMKNVYFIYFAKYYQKSFMKLMFNMK